MVGYKTMLEKYEVCMTFKMCLQSKWNFDNVKNRSKTLKMYSIIETDKLYKQLGNDT